VRLAISYGASRLFWYFCTVQPVRSKAPNSIVQMLSHLRPRPTAVRRASGFVQVGKCRAIGSSFKSPKKRAGHGFADRCPASSVSRPVRQLHLSRLKRNWDVRQRGLVPESSPHKSPPRECCDRIQREYIRDIAVRFDFDVCAFLQATCPFRQFVPADDTMPSRVRLVFVAVLFPTHASRKRQSSVSIAVRCGAALRVLT
jgi:hypothetical protein